MDSRVKIALVLIQEHYGDKLTLERMSEEVHLTKEHFCRLFKAETGFSPVKYVKGWRLQKGKDLIENTVMSVKEIMYKVGVNDESHFVRDFKLAYGLTPMQLRLSKSADRASSHINIG
jgi:transcriptional regulator GlxA family with amidase domain